MLLNTGGKKIQDKNSPLSATFKETKKVTICETINR